MGAAIVHLLYQRMLRKLSTELGTLQRNTDDLLKIMSKGSAG